MDLKELQKHWHQFGKQDPMWAILTWPDKKGNKWSVDEFFVMAGKRSTACWNM